MARKTKLELTAEARLESQLRARTRDKQDVDRKYKALQDDLKRTEQALADSLRIMEHRPKIHRIRMDSGISGGQSTAVALLSDVHCEEVVTLNKTNGLNKHNPDISKRRVARFFDLVVRFIRVERVESRIDNLVLWLGGDFFSSNLHEELPAVCAMPPMEAAMFSQNMIVSGLHFLMEQEPNLKIHVVGSVGNHSRIVSKVYVSTEQEHSIEWMMYHAIAAHFAGLPNMTFQLDNSYHSYLKVYNKVVRFNHGHQVRYNMGLAGVHGPLRKKIDQVWNKQVHADLTCSGHWHTYVPAERGLAYVVNGSTIGASPYGMNFGYEDPCQAFFLIHNKYGVVGQRPLLVDM